MRKRWSFEFMSLSARAAGDMRKRWPFEFMSLSARAAGGEARRGGWLTQNGPSGLGTFA